MAERQLVQIPVQPIGFKAKKDKSWTLTFETRELNGDDLSVIVDSMYGEGWLAYSPNDVEYDDIPDTEAKSGVKTPSQRLRASLYRKWEEGDKKLPFNRFYQAQMERIIEIVNQ